MTAGLTEWLDASEQEVWRRLLAVECTLHDRLDRDLQSTHGLSLGDYDVLVHLSEAPGRSLRMSELADRLLLSRSGLTRRLDGMVSEGLVARMVCPEDRRGTLAELTPKGTEMLREAAATHVAGVRRYLVGPLQSVGGMAAMRPGLGAIEKALES